jgi:hypothetical protein
MVDEPIISALRAGQLEDEALERTRVLLQTGVSPEILVRRSVGVAPSYEVVEKLMSSLEELSSRDVELSLKLMLGLYPVAGEVFAHDVCDSIELWLEHEGTQEVKRFVASLLSVEPPFGAREKLESWIQLLSDR